MLQKCDQKMTGGGLLLLLGGCAGTESSHTGSVLLASTDSCEQVSLPDYQVDSCDCPSVPLDAGEHWGVSLQAPTVQTLSLR